MDQHQIIHTANVAAVAVPFMSWMSHAPDFFTATVGFCGTVWYCILFYEKIRALRKKHDDQKKS